MHNYIIAYQILKIEDMKLGKIKVHGASNFIFVHIIILTIKKQLQQRIFKVNV